MKTLFRNFVFLWACWPALVSITGAQTSGSQPSMPETCDSRTAEQKRDWGKTTHDWLSNVLHKQNVETKQTWCHIWETQGYDRVHKVEDFGRVLFTGEGIHPAVGSIVPGSGFAGGLALNLARAATSPPIRYSGNVEARGSLNGFWVAGSQLNMVGAANTNGEEHIHATFSARHYSLPKLTYFGLGNSSVLSDESVYGLQTTNARAVLDIPLPYSFSFSAVSEGLWANPAGAHDSHLPSIEGRFTSADTPALNTSTSFFVYGAGLGWTYPSAERMYGYRTSVNGLFRVFHEGTGAPYSFRRLDAAWEQQYTPRLSFDLGSFSLTSSLVESITPAGNSVPFYLQPTLGGTNIDNVSNLRSYRDYRFRAPNALSFQADYERAIRDPIGVLFFYDVGKVALQRSDLDFSHMRHSFGIGLTLRAGGLPVLKLYYAWGGKEGAHTTFGGNTNALGESSDLSGVF
jgi:hypothetical protein